VFADISRKRVRGSVSSGVCHAMPAIGVPVELVHHHVIDGHAVAVAQPMLASTSAVQRS